MPAIIRIHNVILLLFVFTNFIDSINARYRKPKKQSRMDKPVNWQYWTHKTHDKDKQNTKPQHNTAKKTQKMRYTDHTNNQG